MVNLQKEKTKVNLKKENRYSSNDYMYKSEEKRFSSKIKNYSEVIQKYKSKERIWSSKSFMQEFMEGPYFHQEYFRGPWTWGCSWRAAILLSLLIPLSGATIPLFLQENFGMDFVIAIIFVCAWGMFFIGIGVHFLATWIRRTFNL